MSRWKEEGTGRFGRSPVIKTLPKEAEDKRRMRRKSVLRWFYLRFPVQLDLCAGPYSYCGGGPVTESRPKKNSVSIPFTVYFASPSPSPPPAATPGKGVRHCCEHCCSCVYCPCNWGHCRALLALRGTLGLLGCSTGCDWSIAHRRDPLSE